MKYCVGFLFVLVSFVVNAAGLNNPRQIEELEYLFNHMGARQLQKVTHRYRDGSRMHDYFLGCVVREGKKKYVGLVSSNWQKCYIRIQKAKLAVRKTFAHLIKGDRELEINAKYVLNYSSKKYAQGYWENLSYWENPSYWENKHNIYLTGAPCLQYVSYQSGRRVEFCLHSETTAKKDLWHEKLAVWGGGSALLAMIIVPSLLAFYMNN